MSGLREALKRRMPRALKQALIRAREGLAPPPLEDIVLHGYRMIPDEVRDPRLTLVIPSIAPEKAFGGVTTGIDIFFEIGRRSNVQLRVVVDEYGGAADSSVLAARAAAAGVEPTRVEVISRQDHAQDLQVRRTDVFITFNWWTTLNIRALIRAQAEFYGIKEMPHIYIIQDYEPSFYPFSSTHMMARMALSGRRRCWGVFNSSELHRYIQNQGHDFEREFVFEPKLSRSLRPFLTGASTEKVRRILVYGRPSIPRNCFPAVEKGLRLWAERYPEFASWQVVSAGTPHPPVRLGPGREIESLGKLSLEAYAQLLRSTAVGLSLMSSPHPSYPPLEMAHFGVRTITNTFANKDLSRSHTNIVSIDEIDPASIADALALACREFQSDPHKSWSASSLRPSFLDPGAWPFLDEVATVLLDETWRLDQ